MNTFFRKLTLLVLATSLVVPTPATSLNSVYANQQNSITVPEVLSEYSNENRYQVLNEGTEEELIVESESEKDQIVDNDLSNKEQLSEADSTVNDSQISNEEGEVSDNEIVTPSEDAESNEQEQAPATDLNGTEFETSTPEENESTSNEATEDDVTPDLPVSDKEVTNEEGEGLNSLDYVIDPTVTFPPSLRSMSAYFATGVEQTSNSYMLNGLQASALADFNTSDSKNPFASGTTTANNGRVWVDKSVTLDQNFNYQTFDSITNGDFNVILSALGQEFTTEETKKVPADVVFVLDVSGSMKNEKVKDSNGDQITRAKAAVNAINIAITKLMEANPETRVSVVTFSGPSSATQKISANDYSKVLLPLASYQANATDSKNGYPYLSYSEDNNKYYVSHADHLRVSNAEVSKVQFIGGTYTQAGIQKGANQLLNNATANRLPVLILVSDGNPTYGCSSYTNVQTSTEGNGTTTTGSMGYHTILTAQYQKDQIKNSQYTYDPLVYTLGLGITDQFGKTVLNPTQANINALSKTSAEQNLKQNLTMNDTKFNKTSYANYSQSGNMTADDLNNLLANMVTNITTVASSPFAGTAQETGIIFTDVIGDGMELKGDTIYVRYAGENYPFKKQNDGTYTSNKEIIVTDDRHNAVILNHVSIKVTEKNGIQTLTWTIPSELVPVYSNYDKYSTTLPIRLVYTVGVKAPVSAGTYYTNAFNESGNIITPLTTAMFTPANNNPYYSSYIGQTITKDSNITETANHSSAEKMSNGVMKVMLGNNGKITLAQVKKDVTVTKEWADYENKHETRPVSIQVQLKQNGVNYGAVVTLNAKTDWTHTWGDLPAYDNEGNLYIYSVVEMSSLTNYTPSYSTNNDSFIITNTLNNVTERTVTKVWEDNHDALGLRPASIQVQLKQNDVNYKDVVTLKASENWTYTWNDLPKYDEAGNEYVYTVQEIDPDGHYEVTYNQSELTITNKLIESGTIHLIKKDQNETPLADVQFKLEVLENGKWVQVKTLTTDHKGTLSFENLVFGRYRLTEIKTAGNHSLLTSPIEFDLPYEESQVTKPNGVIIEAVQGNGQMPILTITVKNNPNGIFGQLPETGGTGIFGYMIGGSCLVGFATVLYSRQARRKSVSKN